MPNHKVLIVRPGTAFGTGESRWEGADFYSHQLMEVALFQRENPDGTLLVLVHIADRSSSDHSLVLGFARVMNVEKANKVGLVLYDDNFNLKSSCDESFLPLIFQVMKGYPTFLMTFLPKDPSNRSMSMSCAMIHPYTASDRYSEMDFVKAGVPYLELPREKFLTFPYEVKNPSYRG